jgi:cytochrome b561
MKVVLSPDRYDVISQCLHWLTALLVVALLISGKVGDVDAEEGNALYYWHSSLGFLVLELVVARIVWRLLMPAPTFPATMSRAAGMLARVFHLAFYLLLIALPVSGWLVASAEGGTVSLFGLTPLPAWNPGTETFEEVHEVLGNVLMILVVLHAIAALKHHFVDRDNVLLRMLPALGKSRGSSGRRGV